MTSESITLKPQSKALTWVGWILGILPSLFMIGGGVLALMNQDKVAQQMAPYGYARSALVPILVTEIVCAVLYLIPQTSVLGAILLTGYLGGATSTHVRAGEPFFFPIIFGIVFWLGLVLRDPRLRTLVPLRRG